MLSPVVAIVLAELGGGTSNRQPPEALAEAAIATPEPAERIELSYVPTTTGWRFLSGRHFSQELKLWLPINLPADPTVFTPYAWLIGGFSVK